MKKKYIAPEFENIDLFNTAIMDIHNEGWEGFLQSNGDPESNAKDFDDGLDD